MVDVRLPCRPRLAASIGTSWDSEVDDPVPLEAHAGRPASAPTVQGSSACFSRIPQSAAKNGLVKRIAAEQRLTQRVVADVVAELQQQVRQALRDGHVVQIPGFGTWKTSHRQARKVQVGRREGDRLVPSGEVVTVPARRVAVFRVGDVLRRAVSGSGKATGESDRPFGLDFLKPNRRKRG